MLNVARSVQSLAVMAALAVAALAPVNVHAQPGTGLPNSILQRLEAPNANVQQISLSIVRSDPVLATSVLQASVEILGKSSNAAANEIKAFADLAAQMIAAGSSRSPALAAALVVAVENVVTDPQNAGLVNGPFAATVAAAKAEADHVLLDAEVQEAILYHVPGTEGVIEAAVSCGVGGFIGNPLYGILVSGPFSAIVASIKADPGRATPILQSAVEILGNTQSAANEIKAFADLAKQMATVGPSLNPALAAAMAVAVENVVGNPRNAGLVNGPFAATVAAAKAEADEVSRNAEVRRAILDRAPGAGGIVQAAGCGGGGFGSFGGGAAGAAGGGSSPSKI